MSRLIDAEILVGKTKYRVEQAVSFLTASISEYMKAAASELLRTNPDINKVNRLVHLAHTNAVALEDITVQALSQGFRLDEQDLVAVRGMHDGVHALMTTLTLSRAATAVVEHSQERAKSLNPEDFHKTLN